MDRVIRRFYIDLKKYRHYFRFSVILNLKSELSNTFLGYLWWILDPILHMLVYTFLVQVIFRRATPAFPVYVFCALLPWKVASNTMSRSTTCIRQSAGITKQIYLPSFLHVLIILSTNSIKFFFGLLVLFGLIVIYKIPLTWHVIEIVPTYIVMFLFFFGVSLFIAHFGVVFHDIKNLMVYIILFWFFGSPGMWTIDLVPANLMQLILINPNTTFFTSFRNSLMYGQSPDYLLLSMWFFVSILLIFLGLYLMYSNEKNYTKVI